MRLAVDTLRGEPDREVAVHEARKALKRTRAWLRLVRNQIGYFRYRQENVVLRDTARRLSPVRSAAVMVATARSVLDHASLPAPHEDRLISVLGRRHRGLGDDLEADGQLLLEATTTLGCAAHRYAAWPTAHATTDFGRGDRRPLPDRYETVAPGLRRTYRRGRRALDRALEEPTFEVLHAWRKQAKYLRHQLECLERGRTDTLGRLAGSFDDLATVLGDEHDLAELGIMVATDPELLAPGASRDRVLAVIDRQRSTLRDQAFDLGTGLYRERPKVFTSRIGSYLEP